MGEMGAIIQINESLLQSKKKYRREETHLNHHNHLNKSFVSRALTKMINKKQIIVQNQNPCIYIQGLWFWTSLGARWYAGKMIFYNKQM